MRPGERSHGSDVQELNSKWWEGSWSHKHIFSLTGHESWSSREALNPHLQDYTREAVPKAWQLLGVYHQRSCRGGQDLCSSGLCVLAIPLAVFCGVILEPLVSPLNMIDNYLDYLLFLLVDCETSIKITLSVVSLLKLIP